MEEKSWIYLLHPFIDVVCGAIAGASGNLTGHPIDTIKLRKQISKSDTSAFEIMRKIRAKEGVRLTHTRFMVSSKEWKPRLSPLCHSMQRRSYFRI